MPPDLTTTTATEDVREQVVEIKRMAKVGPGGKAFLFSVLAVAGNGAGKVGTGTAKDHEASQAMSKAMRAAVAAMAQIAPAGPSISRECSGSHGSIRVTLRPGPAGSGLDAQKTIRAILEVGGFQDIQAELQGKDIPVAVVNATMAALRSLGEP